MCLPIILIFQTSYAGSIPVTRSRSDRVWLRKHHNKDHTITPLRRQKAPHLRRDGALWLASVQVFELVGGEPVVATDWTRRCITRVSYFEPHAVVGPRVAVSNLDHLAGTAVVLVERNDFHPVTDRELRHVPDSSIWSLPSTS